MNIIKELWHGNIAPQEVRNGLASLQTLGKKRVRTHRRRVRREARTDDKRCENRDRKTQARWLESTQH